MNHQQSTGNKLTIGLIDTFPIYRIGLTVAFREKFGAVLVSSGGDLDELVEKLDGAVPDLLVMVITAEQTQRLDQTLVPARLRFPEVPAVVCFNTVNETVMLKCLRAGVLGYLLNESSVDELFACIESVLKRRRYMNDLMGTLLFDLLVDERRLSKVEKVSTLNSREFAVAGLLSKGVKPSTIARTLGISPSSVSFLKKNIFQKLRIQNVRELGQVVEPGIGQTL